MYTCPYGYIEKTKRLIVCKLKLTSDKPDFKEELHAACPLQYFCQCDNLPHNDDMAEGCYEEHANQD